MNPRYPESCDILWNAYLCDLPHGFRRNAVLGGFVADFYCSRARLAVNVGAADSEQLAMRGYLESLGGELLCIHPGDVKNLLGGVCAIIGASLDRRIGGRS